MQHLLQENFYLRQRIAELERENQYIKLMLAAKTLYIEKVNFKFENISIENLSGSLQIGLAHQAESTNDSPIHLPNLQNGSTMRI